MDIQFNYDYRKDDVEVLPLDELALFTLNFQKMPENTEASVTFVDDDRMAFMNETYRGKQGPTDVLSFECDGLDDDFADSNENTPYELGDIIIAPDVATRQTDEFGTTFEQEMSLLLVHGLLHLCGYDHIEDEEAECMEALEKEILEGWAHERGQNA